MAVQIPFPLPSTGFALNSKMRVNLDFLVGQFNEFNSGTATWDQVAIGSANSLTGTLTFYNSSNANYLTFRPGATSTNTTFTLPTAAPASIGLLSSTSGGVMSFIAGSSGVLTSDGATFSFVAGTGLFYNGTSFSGAAAQARSLVMLGTGGTPVLADHQYNVTAASNGLLYIPSGVEVKPLANGLGVVGILSGSTSGTPKFIDILGTSNQVIVTKNSNDWTLTTPQSIGTTSNVIFNSLQVDGGSATNPGIRVIFSGASTNTGLWSGSGTELNMTVAGATRFSIDSTGIGVATGELRAPTIRGTTDLRVSTGAGPLITVNGPSSGSPWTFTFPTSGGTNNYVLSTNGSGTTSWVAVGSTGGATTALDNLAAVAINTTLVSDTNNTDDLGTTSIGWRSLYLGTSIKSGATTLATTTELGYLTGVSSAIQTQLNAKATDSLVAHLAGIETLTGAKTFSATLTMSGATIAMGTNKITGLAAATTSGDALRYEQLFGGTVTLTDDLIFNPTTKGVRGTTTNDSAVTGNVGEYVLSSVTSNVNAGTSAQWADATSISLTAGDWIVSGQANLTLNGSVVSGLLLGISVTSGNSGTGIITALNESEPFIPTATSNSAGCISDWHLQLTGTTTVYLKHFWVYTGATPQLAGCSLKAVRIR